MLLPFIAALALSANPAETGAPPQVFAEGLSPEAIAAALAPARHPILGVAVDAAFPDGLGVSLLVMPLDFLRLEAGGLSNGVGLGVRGGATLVAFPRSPFRPTLGVEAGYTWGGTGMWAMEYITDATLRAALSNLTVGFVTARVGFELGSKNLALTVQLGASYLDALLGVQTLDLGNGVTLQATGSRLKGFVPSLRVGFIICFG
jgi:hypothetical protein